MNVHMSGRSKAMAAWEDRETLALIGFGGDEEIWFRTRRICFCLLHVSSLLYKTPLSSFLSTLQLVNLLENRENELPKKQARANSWELEGAMLQPGIYDVVIQPVAAGCSVNSSIRSRTIQIGCIL